ncbi:MAG TPA: hypothetical protein VHK90_09265 [Thermoanaerobaculia bacterium]|nr:hypothetical protein [Thermoanaerobaculia bacterium]
MRSTFRVLAIAAFAMLIAAPAALAQTPEVSTLPVDEPLDVGGTILQPGTYQIRVVPSLGDRNRVQITSVDGTKIYATVLTVPHDLEPGEDPPNTTFVYYPAGEGQPRALRTWFAPGGAAMDAGHDIVYEESRARQLARLANSRVVAYPEDATIAENTTLNVVTPDARIETYTVTTTPAPTPAPAPVVETETETVPMTSAQPEQVAEATPVEMPRTAGHIPVIALFGLLSLGAAAAARAARRS